MGSYTEPDRIYPIIHRINHTIIAITPKITRIEPTDVDPTETLNPVKINMAPIIISIIPTANNGCIYCVTNSILKEDKRRPMSESNGPGMKGPTPVVD